MILAAVGALGLGGLAVLVAALASLPSAEVPRPAPAPAAVVIVAPSAGPPLAEVPLPDLPWPVWAGSHPSEAPLMAGYSRIWTATRSLGHWGFLALGVASAWLANHQARADEPVASIAAPSSASAGDLVVLDASASKGADFDWELVGSDKPFLPVEDGRKVVFATRTPGSYTFLLYVAGPGADGKVKIARARAVVTLTGPAPAPVVPPAPDNPPDTPPVKPPSPPAPGPQPEPIQLGQDFREVLIGTLAEGFDAMAIALHSGKTMAEADTILKDTFQGARDLAFVERVGTAMKAILPEKTEPTPAQRDAMIAFARGFAIGLKMPPAQPKAPAPPTSHAEPAPKPSAEPALAPEAVNAALDALIPPRPHPADVLGPYVRRPPMRSKGGLH